jgi:DNA-3-methyladenine glycosylase I
VFWAQRPGPAPAPRTSAELHSSTPASTTLAKRLAEEGFRFVGPTTVYAAMQACGVVNDHLADCPVRDEVERERAD